MRCIFSKTKKTKKKQILLIFCTISNQITNQIEISHHKLQIRTHNLQFFFLTILISFEMLTTTITEIINNFLSLIRKLSK